MAESDLNIEALSDEIKVLKGEVRRTLVDLRALLMREDSPLNDGHLARRSGLLAEESDGEPRLSRKEVEEIVRQGVVDPVRSAVAAAPPPPPVINPFQGANTGMGMGSPGLPMGGFGPGSMAPQGMQLTPGGGWNPQIAYPQPQAPPAPQPAPFSAAASLEQERRMVEQERKIVEQERRLAEQERAIGSSHRPEAGQDRQVATERRREDPVRLPPELTRGEARAGGPGVADLNGALHDEGRLTPPHYSNDGGEQAGEAAYRREQAGEVAYPREQAGEAAYPREQAGEVAYPREQAGEVTYRREQAGGPDRAPLAGNRLNVRPKDEDGDTAAEERQSSGGSLAEETLGRGEMGPATRRQWRAGMERAKTSPDDPGDGWHRPSHRNGGGSRVYGEYLELLRETEQLIPVEDNDNGARPLDVNLLSGLTRWASVAQSRVGEKGLKEVLDLYARSGHLSEGLRSVLLQVSGMVGGVPPEAGHNAQEYVDLICQLHGILTGSLHISQAPPARPLE